jgi:crossover junction endonuclease EME1
MDTGQVRTGEDAADTYVKMLQQVVRVTAPIAYGIAAEYPDVLSLIRGFERKGSTMLEDLKKSANRTGGFSDARIGPAISRRLEKVFLGTDPFSKDI